MDVDKIESSETRQTLSVLRGLGLNVFPERYSTFLMGDWNSPRPLAGHEDIMNSMPTSAIKAVERQLRFDHVLLESCSDLYKIRA